MGIEVTAEARRLSASGYVCVSNTHRMLKRIDRPDWQEHMAGIQYRDDLARGLKWVERMGKASAAAHYRTVHSKDMLKVEEDVFRAVKRLNRQSIPDDYKPLQRVAPRNVRLEP